MAINLALSINNPVQFLDCDVEEPNAHIFLKPKIKKTQKIFIPIPKIDESKCNYCGRCAEVCAYNAIAVLKDNVLTFPNLCHGCGGCTLLCPQGAISEVDKEIGVVNSGAKHNIQFVDASLNIGEAMAPPLIRAVKKHINHSQTVIIDAPPGTSCPVIESIKGSDFSLLVTEPTPFGLNDLILAVEVLRKLKIPFAVIINRSESNQMIDSYCRKEDIEILMRIPFKKEIAIAYSKGIPLINALPEYRKGFVNLFQKIKEKIK